VEVALLPAKAIICRLEGILATAFEPGGRPDPLDAEPDGPGAGPAPGLPSRALFDFAPTATAEHDYSAVRTRLRELVSSGVRDLGAWLVAHPEEVAELAQRVRILDVNAAGMALTRAATKEEAIRSLDQYFTRASLPAFARALVTLASGSPLVDCELPFRDRTGRDLTVVAYASPLPGSEETLEHVLVSFFDVTERKEAERRLRESEALLRASQWIARLGHYVLDVERGFWSSSEALDDLFGIDAGYLRSIDGWLGVVHPEDRAAMSDYFALEVLAQRRPFDREYRIVRISDGATRWVHGRGELELSSTGQPVRMVGIIQDITEAREAAEERLRLSDQLRHAQKMESLGRLAGGVAHDFNNMLAVILGHVDLALKTPGLGEELREDLREVRDAAARSADLTRQLLGFARQQPIRPRPLDLGEAVMGMGRMLEKLAGERIRLELRLAQDLWPTLADPSQIDQVITNLVANARDATPGKGELRIETSNVTIQEPHSERTFQVSPGDYAALSVTDSGAGMDPTTLRHLFEPFFTTKPVGRGTGLGLANVYGIVRQNRGGVEVRTAVGQGTTFRILFPRYRGEAGTEPGVVKATGPAPRGAETILVVEDEPAVLKVVQRALEWSGYRVLPARHPEEALAILRAPALAIDLIVTDMMMPGMTGRELAVAALLERPALRVLYLSGHAADPDAPPEAPEEELEFLQKPFTPAALALKVRELLDRR
jgi:PAS domain S-box-containing protein